MTLDFAKDLWTRAQNALRSAEALLGVSGDDAASRAYYAVFNAASALFALRGKTFKRHAEVRAAVHRDLVKAGEWDQDLGAAFDSIWELRDVGDYGGDEHVSPEEARAAVATAKRVLEAVSAACPELRQP